MTPIKGTRVIDGKEAVLFSNVVQNLENIALFSKFEQIILPTLSDPGLWVERSGPEIESQMWMLSNKEPTCLIPEATALVQRLYDDHWSMSKKKPVRVFYTTRAYRYETRVQNGRYREFTQFGVEMLGPKPEEYEEELKALLILSLDALGVKFTFDDSVERGLSYYSRNGFEARVDTLGTVKQIAGGGVYKQGCGWAIGVDRVVQVLLNS